MTEVVHVYGHSSMGKRTFIKALRNETNGELRKRFGIHGSTDIFLNQNEVGRAFDPDMPWRRVDELPTELERGATTHLLHKWQFGTQEVVLDLRAKLPSHCHRIIALWRTPEEVLRRILEKNELVPPQHQWTGVTLEILRDELYGKYLGEVGKAAAQKIPVVYAIATDDPSYPETTLDEIHRSRSFEKAS